LFTRENDSTVKNLQMAQNSWGPERGEGVKHCQKRRKDRLEMRLLDTIREEAAGLANGYEKKADEEGKKLRIYKVFPK
jgi:hypothetical protein